MYLNAVVELVIQLFIILICFYIIIILLKFKNTKLGTKQNILT